MILGFNLDTKEFKAAVTGIKKNIKQAGKGDTEHFAPLPDDVVASIHNLLGKVQAVMKARLDSNPIAYEKVLSALSHEFKNNYHELLLLGTQYIVHSFDIRRGREGIADLKKGHFKLVEQDGFKFFRKVNFFDYQSSKCK